MRRLIKRGLAVVVFFVSLSVGASSDAWALTVLKADEASGYLGDVRDHLLSGKYGQYTYDVLSRSHRDAMHGRFSDGVICNAKGGNFLFPRGKDGDRTIVIDAPNGREEAPVTQDAWLGKIKNTLSDDNRIPYVFFDDAKNEIAIAFVGSDTQVTWRLNDQQLLEISIKIEGSGGRSSSRRRGAFN